MARTRCYRAGVLSDENVEWAEVSEHLDEPDAVVWIDMVVLARGHFSIIRSPAGDYPVRR